MSVYDEAHALARAIRESDEARETAHLREAAEADDTNRALLTEYRRLQTSLQMQTVSGAQVDAEAMRRFQQIASVLCMNQDVQAYLLAEFRLQKLMADIFQIISEASGIKLEIPGA